jgi:hypothetical protein
VVSSRISDLLRSGRIHRVNRLIISSTKKTRDLQLLVEEQKHGVSYDGRRFVVSDMLAFFLRLGVRTYVMRHPEDATPAMWDIADKGPGTDKILARRFDVTFMRSRNPLPDDNSVVPKWGFLS